MAHRKFLASFATTVAVVTMAVMPGISAANNYLHPTPNEVGVKAYPEHFESTETRGQVRSAAAQAVRDGGDTRFTASNYPADVKTTGSGKTRQQVIDELLTEAPSQREARRQAMAN